MTQPHLLEFSDQVELAKQGEPQAISTLINVTLEPKGVTATAAIEDNCLHVFLRSARVLNAKALVAFIQRGILRLEVASIDRVQVYGQRFEDDQPLWVETFVVPRSQIADALEALSHPSSSYAASSYPPIPDPLTVAVGHSQSSNSQSSNSQSSTATLSNGWNVDGWNADGWKQQWAERTALLKASLTQTFGAWKFLAQRRDRLPPQHERVLPEPSDALQSKSQSVSYVKLSLLVTLAAFITGGAVALIANSNTVGGDRKTGAKVSTIASESQQTIKTDAEKLREQQQATAKKYLESMNKAQQKFYRQNNRFASTLEELERFAVVPIATRSDYVYKLIVPSKTQSQLTAVPKADGLKSYTAAVSIAKASHQAVAAICASQQAANVPPLVFQSEGTVQCPVEPAKAP